MLSTPLLICSLTFFVNRVISSFLSKMRCERSRELGNRESRQMGRKASKSKQEQAKQRKQYSTVALLITHNSRSSRFVASTAVERCSFREGLRRAVLALVLYFTLICFDLL